MIELLSRPLYGFGQVDDLLSLKPGTARRWIDGYSRGGKSYPPVVRSMSTGTELVTWGEFVETRFLAEYRDAGVPMIHMRPAVECLKEEYQTPYPLAFAKPFVSDRELVLRIQESVGLASPLRLVVVRSGQLLLTSPAEQFWRAVEFDREHGVALRIHPLPDSKLVVVDPLRRFGLPVVRAVPTEIIAEQVRAGEGLATIGSLYELSVEEVEAAVRYELISA